MYRRRHFIFIGQNKKDETRCRNECNPPLFAHTFRVFFAPFFEARPGNLLKFGIQRPIRLCRRARSFMAEDCGNSFKLGSSCANFCEKNMAKTRLLKFKRFVDPNCIAGTPAHQGWPHEYHEAVNARAQCSLWMTVYSATRLKHVKPTAKRSYFSLSGLDESRNTKLKPHKARVYNISKLNGEENLCAKSLETGLTGWLRLSLTENPAFGRNWIKLAFSDSRSSIELFPHPAESFKSSMGARSESKDGIANALPVCMAHSPCWAWQQTLPKSMALAFP